MSLFEVRKVDLRPNSNVTERLRLIFPVFLGDDATDDFGEICRISYVDSILNFRYINTWEHPQFKIYLCEKSKILPNSIIEYSIRVISPESPYWDMI